MLGRHGDRLGARMDAQLVEGRGEMLGDSALGDEEVAADGLIRETLRHQPQHLTFAGAQRARRPGLEQGPLGFLARRTFCLMVGGSLDYLLQQG